MQRKTYYVFFHKYGERDLNSYYSKFKILICLTPSLTGRQYIWPAVMTLHYHDYIRCTDRHHHGYITLRRYVIYKLLVIIMNN